MNNGDIIEHIQQHSRLSAFVLHMGYDVLTYDDILYHTKSPILMLGCEGFINTLISLSNIRSIRAENAYSLVLIILTTYGWSEKLNELVNEFRPYDTNGRYDILISRYRKIDML